MLDEKVNPRLIKRANLRFPYTGSYKVRGMNSSRQITFPSKLRGQFEERSEILGSDHFVGKRICAEDYKFICLWDYAPDLPRFRFHEITIFGSGDRLYVPIGINLAHRDLIFLGMGQLIELWYKDDFERYFESQTGLRARNPPELIS